jgi:hypothetical protein
VFVKAVMPALMATVSGTVFASDGVTPLTGAFNINLLTSTGTALTGTPLANGQYAFATRALGTEGVRVRASLQGLSDGYVEAVSGPITQNGQRITVNLTLPSSVVARISGRVVSSADHQTPVQGATIYLLARHSGELITYASTDGDGRYAIDAALPADGLFTVRVLSPFNAANQVEQNGSATSQNALVELPLSELRVSVLKGYVRFHDGQPVPSPTIVGRYQYGSAQIAWATEPDGSYLCLGWPPSAYTVTAQDNVSGLSTSADVTIPSDDALVTLDLTMPPSGTVSVRVLDQNGNHVTDARVALTSEAQSFERVAGPSETLKPDAEGRYVFTRVPIGSVYIQATRSCGSSCLLFASADGVLAAADQTLELVVSFQDLGSVQVSLLDNPTPTQAVTVRITALGSSGPLGSYWTAKSLPAGTTQYAASNVPPGAVRVEASSNWGNQIVPAGQADGLLAPGSPGLLTLDVPIGNALSFGEDRSKTVPLAGGPFTYGVHGQGLVSSSLSDGSLLHTLHEAGLLAVGGYSGEAGYVPAARAEMAGRQLVLGPQTFGRGVPFELTRKIYVPADGRFARWLDLVTNRSGSPFTARIVLSSPINYSPLVELAPPSATVPGSAVFRGWEGSAGASAYVFSGANPPLLAVDAHYDSSPYDYPVIRCIWDIEVPAHGSVALLHFAAADLPDAVDAMRALAEALGALTEPGALDGLTAGELALVVNFRLSPPSPAPDARPVASVAQALEARSLAGVWDGLGSVGQPAEESTFVPAGK